MYSNGTTRRAICGTKRRVCRGRSRSFVEKPGFSLARNDDDDDDNDGEITVTPNCESEANTYNRSKSLARFQRRFRDNNDLRAGEVSLRSFGARCFKDFVDTRAIASCKVRLFTAVFFIVVAQQKANCRALLNHIYLSSTRQFADRKVRANV